MLLKNSIIIIGSSSTEYFKIEFGHLKIRTVVTFSIGRFMKQSFLLITLCYCTFITKCLVLAIRGTLYDYLNADNLSKIERRKLKAFLQMTQDNDFSYTLWGVIPLNMSLPLKYYAVCLTYLIIVYQFSKFIY
ncbi:uncharacterized protein LOC133320804 [Danaus plexippus]|uniref:uncharacterized protein LOC133320804 n=1 Tax=Danaus plexippus TaxID=13037 RepID=UPI002AB2F6F0|nr:uncharacterized protein LOC133320804 [Danaus plexippus]